MTFAELMEETKKPWNKIDEWRAVFIWETKDGYTIDEEYSTTSDDYNDFKQQYFEYDGHTVLHYHYTTEEAEEGRKKVLNILLLGEDYTLT